MILARAIFLIAIAFICIPANAFAEKRVALVIGNSAYASAGRLANPTNDAADVAAALQRLGFDVTRETDVDGRGFVAVIDNFLSAAKGADLAIFYYAGHGMQYDGASYLLPVDAKLESEFAIRRETMAAQEIVSALEGAAQASVVILDACRNNPLAELLRARLQGRGRAAAVARGLGRIEASSGNTLVVYSAAPGQEAKDGAGRNSPFTEALLKHVETPGLEIEQMLKRVTADVERDTAGKQQPERLSRLKIELTLKGGRPSTPQQSPDSQLAASQARINDLEAELRRQAEAQRTEQSLSQMQARIKAMEAELRQRKEAERSEQPLSQMQTRINAMEAELQRQRADAEHKELTRSTTASLNISPQEDRDDRPVYRIAADVSDGVLNMRSGPGQGHNLVTAIPAGSGGVKVGRCRNPDDGRSRNTWCEVEWRGRTGWASSCCFVK